MPIKIIRQDITKIKCDAIVDPTDARYSHGGGVDAAIHGAAGVELYHACVDQGKLDTEPLITHTYPLAKIDEAYELFENKRDGVIKVAVEC